MKLILGSASKWRKIILDDAGYTFDVISPDIDEKAIKTDDPYRRPLILARAKADALEKILPEDAISICADTVIVANGKLYEKPENLEEARKFLYEYNEGLVPEVVTGMVVLNKKTGERYEGLEKATVFFKKFPDEMIEQFLKEGSPLSLAGGFGIEHPIMKPYVERVDGTYDNVVGIPLKLLKELLTKAGYEETI